MDPEMETAYRGIVRTLVRYGGLSESEAQQRLSTSSVMDLDDDMARELFFHEEPYYWAMSILYGKTDPNWYHDPARWPSPTDYYDPEWRKTWSE